MHAVERGESHTAGVGRVARPRGVCRRGVWVRGRLVGVRLVLSAGGGLDLAAAPTSPATVITSAKSANVTKMTTITVALISAPWGVGEMMLPVLGVWPGPVACVGRMPGCGGGCWACAG